jgi:hypothetical protein
VSDARRDGLRAAEESAATFPEKAGLAGANILCLFIFGVSVDLEELAFALSNSVVKYKHKHHDWLSKIAHHSFASSQL